MPTSAWGQPVQSPIEALKQLRHQVQVACLACRKRRTKCSGHRPRCDYCSKRGHRCGYEVEEGVSRAEHMRESLKKADIRIAGFETLLGKLAKGTDQESTMVLASLRLGIPLDRVIEAVKSKDKDLHAALKVVAKDTSP